ncbi:MAG: 50S ribosomal protein P1 [Burkholderiales bacterium]
MEYIYAALLLHRLKQPVTEEGVKKIVQAAGGKVDDARAKALVAALGEIKIDDALKTAVAAPLVPAPAAAAPAAPAGAPAKPAEGKQESEEKKEEEALAGLSSLFG